MFPKKNELVSAYVIHTRPFQDNKILIDLLTTEYGLVRAVWRLPKKEARVVPASFLPYEVLLKGKKELKSLHLLESTYGRVELTGLKLFTGIYAHELLLKLLPMNLPIASFFEIYEWLITSLQADVPIAPLLRRFEYALFDEIGSTINFNTTTVGAPLESDVLYGFDAQFGLRPYSLDAVKSVARRPLLLVEGRLAMQYAQGQWSNGAVLRLAKELHRHWLNHLLDGKEIEARKLLPTYSYDGERHFDIPVFRT
ncbi:DNA repair protein RecO [Marinomonas agarivorans]|nr:DNA repair protein RecO [Marinomonas agarivorans]